MTENTMSIEEQYAQFWKQFQLFSVRWANALLRRPRWFFVLFLLTYGPFLWGLIAESDTLQRALWWRLETLRPWFGDVFIGMAEAHLLTLATLPVALTFVRWASTIPDTLEWLRKPIPRLSSDGSSFESEYLSYLRDYQQQLLSRKYSLALSFSVILIVVLFMIVLGFDPSLTLREIFSSISMTALLIFFLVWGYLMGLIIWPVFVTMRFTRELSDRFKIKIQPSHPDRCGGLKPLGDFCFSMTLPVVIGGLVLALVGVVGLALSVGEAGTNLYRFFGICEWFESCYFNPFFAFLALILLVFLFTPLILATFFLPLWSIHRFMAAGKREAEDAFARRVAGLEAQIRSHLDQDKGIDEAGIARDKLEILQAVNPGKAGYPVWPFRATVLITLFSPQILSVAAFGLSVYEVFKE